MSVNDGRPWLCTIDGREIGRRRHMSDACALACTPWIGGDATVEHADGGARYRRIGEVRGWSWVADHSERAVRDPEQGYLRPAREGES